MIVKKTIVYFVLPLVVTSSMVLMYFSGIEWLQLAVSPKIQSMSPMTAREFGLLENLQNLILLAMLVIVILGLRKKETLLEKAGLLLLIPFTIFVFLEEIDYGLHYYEYLNDVRWSDSAKVRNWHNQGDRTGHTKQAVDALMVILFVISPFALMRSRRPLVRFLTPDRYSALTMVAAFLVRTLAHELKDRGFGDRGTIHSNLSEFREVITYYVFMLYVFQIALRRKLHALKEPD